MKFMTYDLEVYFEVYNQYCKPPQNFDFKNTGLFIWFEKFLYVFVILTWWEDATYCLPFVLFGHQNGSSEFLQKTISNIVDSSKSIQKNQNAPTRTHKKSQILLYRFLDEYT